MNMFRNRFDEYHASSPELALYASAWLKKFTDISPKVYLSHIFAFLLFPY